MITYHRATKKKNHPSLYLWLRSSSSSRSGANRTDSEVARRRQMQRDPAIRTPFAPSLSSLLYGRKDEIYHALATMFETNWNKNQPSACTNCDLRTKIVCILLVHARQRVGRRNQLWRRGEDGKIAVTGRDGLWFGDKKISHRVQSLRSRKKKKKRKKIDA